VRLSTWRRPVVAAAVGLAAATVVALSASGTAAVPDREARPGASRPVTTRAPIGAVTIGRVAPTGTSMCSAGYVWFQAFMDPVNPSYALPYGGVVTSVSHYANANAAHLQAVFLVPTATATGRRRSGRRRSATCTSS
jgi:hypothetical protein